MPRRKILTVRQAAVLVVLGDESKYGYEVLRGYNELMTPFRMNGGSLYVTLKQLEGSGNITSLGSMGVPSKGGATRNYYAVTPEGKKSLSEFSGLAGRVMTASRNHNNP